MLANKSVITGNPADINMHDDYTTIYLKVFAPRRDINSQLLNNIGFGNKYYDYSYEQSSNERFQTNTINVNHIMNIYIHSSTPG